jgi:multiple sugar transport system ATP-binding protein
MDMDLAGGSSGIRLDHLQKSFGTARAVDDLSLEIHDKELLVLLGPSGCGKTTTMNMLAGLEEPTSGEIFFGSRCVTRVPAEDRDVAMVFQTFALYPHLNVRENIGFALKVRGQPRNLVDNQVREVATLLHIERYLNRKVTELSGGERQRVAIAKALVRRPFLFLLDEPFSSIDAIMRREFRAELSRLHREVETTMVFVTHDQEEAMSIADRVAVMRNGELMALGPPLDLYRKPVNMWVAQFIGAQPINIVDCQLDGPGSPASLFAGRVSTAVDPQFQARVRSVTSADEIWLGVRPEFVSLNRDTTSAHPLRAQVFTRQVLGNQILYDLDVAGAHLRSVTPTRDVFAIDEMVNVDFDWANVLAFDRSTESCLVN